MIIIKIPLIKRSSLIAINFTKLLKKLLKCKELLKIIPKKLSINHQKFKNSNNIINNYQKIKSIENTREVYQLHLPVPQILNNYQIL